MNNLDTDLIKAWNMFNLSSLDTNIFHITNFVSVFKYVAKSLMPSIYFIFIYYFLLILIK